MLDWIYCCKNDVSVEVVGSVHRNTSSVYRQILSFESPANGAHSGSFQLEIGTTYQDHAVFTLKIEHGKLILDQHSRPDFTPARSTDQLNRIFSDNSTENSDEAVIPFDELRKECLRAYIQQTPEPGELNFEGLHIRQGDLAGLSISPAVARKLVAAGHSRVVLDQYVQTERDKGNKNIDISYFDLTKIDDFTDVNLQGVNLMRTIESRPDLHEKLKAARLDAAAREYLDIAAIHPARLTEPRPVILHSLVDYYTSQADTVALPAHFLSLAHTLDDLHGRDILLGNIDLDHLRFYKGQAIHVNRQDRNSAAATSENELEHSVTTAQSTPKIQDQLHFFNTIIDAWAATRNQERHLAVDGFLSSLDCTPGLKSELTLFLLDPNQVRQPLQYPLVKYLERETSDVPKTPAVESGSNLTVSVVPPEIARLEKQCATASGALNYSGSTCLNQGVEAAIVEVINKGTESAPSEKLRATIATIFANAVHYNYLPMLVGLLSAQCPHFCKGMERCCEQLQLKDNLRQHGIIFPIGQTGLTPQEAMIQMSAIPSAPVYETGIIGQALHDYLPSELDSLIGGYSYTFPIELNRENLPRIREIFSEPGHQLYKDKVINIGLKTGTSMERANFREIDLRGHTLQGELLNKADLGRTKLAGVTLTGRFCGTNLRSLRGARIINANLEEIETPYRWSFFPSNSAPPLSFANGTLENVKLRVKFTNFDFTNARLTNIDLRGWPSSARLTGATLSHVNLSGYDLEGNNLTNSNWDNVDVSNANLAGAVFRNARLNNVNFHQAKSLKGMKIDERSLQSLDWKTKDYLMYLIAKGDVIKI